jgi:hypothetical protein
MNIHDDTAALILLTLGGLCVFASVAFVIYLLVTPLSDEDKDDK